MAARESGLFVSDADVAGLIGALPEGERAKFEGRAAACRGVRAARLRELVDVLLEKLGPTARFQALRRGLVADCTVVSDGDRGEVCLLGPVAGGIVDRLVDELLRETDSLRDRLDAALERSLSASLRDSGARPAVCCGAYEGMLLDGTVPAPPAFLNGADAVYVLPLSEDGVRILGCRTPSQHAARIAGELRAKSGPGGAERDGGAPADDGGAGDGLVQVPCWRRVPADAGALRLGTGLTGRAGFREGDELAVVGCGDCFEIWRAADWRACSEGLSDLLEAGLFDEGARGTDPAGR